MGQLIRGISLSPPSFTQELLQNQKQPGTDCFQTIFLVEQHRISYPWGLSLRSLFYPVLHGLITVVCKSVPYWATTFITTGCMLLPGTHTVHPVWLNRDLLHNPPVGNDWCTRSLTDRLPAAACSCYLSLSFSLRCPPCLNMVKIPLFSPFKKVI